MTDTLDEGSIDKGSIFSNIQETLTGAEALEWAEYLHAEAAEAVKRAYELRGTDPAHADFELQAAADWDLSAKALGELAERGGDITLQDVMPLLEGYITG